VTPHRGVIDPHRGLLEARAGRYAGVIAGPYKAERPAFAGRPWGGEIRYLDMCAEEVFALRGESPVTRGRRKQRLNDRYRSEEKARCRILREAESEGADDQYQRQPKVQARVG